MAHPMRSMVRSLLDGMTDGTYKKYVPDTANPSGTAWDRVHNMQWPYGFSQSATMETADARIFHPDAPPYPSFPQVPVRGGGVRNLH